MNRWLQPVMGAGGGRRRVAAGEGAGDIGPEEFTSYLKISKNTTVSISFYEINTFPKRCHHIDE